MAINHRRVYVSILLLHGILIKSIHINKKIKNNYEIQEVLILRSTALPAVQGITPLCCPHHRITFKNRRARAFLLHTLTHYILSSS